MMNYRKALFHAVPSARFESDETSASREGR